jgi:TetR/AcrR family transcriptional repressor of mexJK operon
MSAAPRTHGARGAATIVRLLDSASEILCEFGAAAISVQRVAKAAGTSKALVHYHFPGKEALLVSCIERLAVQLEDAEGDALGGSHAASALSDLWHALMTPRTRGWRRALLSLRIGATPAMGAALAAASVRRHTAAARVLARLEALLGFAPAIPRATVAAAYVALVDGLTLDHSIDTDARLRQAFDAFWLALLSLEA